MFRSAALGSSLVPCCLSLAASDKIISLLALATSATLQNTSSYVDGYTGTVSAEQSPLAPNASATLEFVIKVNPLTP